MIRPPTQIPGGAGGTNTSDDVGGIALVVLTESLRQMGPEAMKATGEGIYWQSSRTDAQVGRRTTACEERADADGFLSHREQCLVGKMYLEGTLDTRERIIKINKSVQDRTAD